MFHVLDTPGHIDFLDETEASIRLADGVMIVVDAIEGVMLTTDRIIQSCIKNNLSITLCINKIDRLILELKIPPLDAYYKMKNIIDEVNMLIDNYSYGTYSRDVDGNVNDSDFI